MKVSSNCFSKIKDITRNMESKSCYLSTSISLKMELDFRIGAVIPEYERVVVAARLGVQAAILACDYYRRGDNQTMDCNSYRAMYGIRGCVIRNRLWRLPDGERCSYKL